MFLQWYVWTCQKNRQRQAGKYNIRVNVMVEKEWEDRDEVD